MFRRLLLRLSENEAAGRKLTRFKMTRRAVHRFMAGESLEEALQAVEELNARGARVSLNCLGESVLEKEGAERARAEYLIELKMIQQHGLDANISVKLSQLGLDINKDYCYELTKSIAETAREQGIDIEVDMESSAYTDRTLDIVFPLNDTLASIGVAIQAYLYRSAKDIEELMRRGIKIRLVKGAYQEPTTVAFPSKRQVDGNYYKLMQRLFDAAPAFAIATHDEKMLSYAFERLSGMKMKDRRFEFQMIYGIRRDLQKQILEMGWPLRVYVPYGTHWYPYFMRRLAERPANVWFVMRNLFHK